MSNSGQPAPVPPLPPPLTDLSDAGLRAAIEADTVATRLYDADVPLEAHAEPDADWAVAPLGDSYRTVVVSARFAAADADRRIREITAAFDRRGTGALWWLAPFHRPADLPERLERAGLIELGRAPAMALDLQTLPEDPRSLPAGVDVHPVRGPDDVAGYVAVETSESPPDGPPLPDGLVEVMRDHVASTIGRGPVPSRWVARVEGRVVGTSRVSLAGGAAGLYAVVTLPEARGRGIGTALTLAPLRAARGAGYGIATLQASDAGLRIYERLGFRTLFDYRILLRLPPDAPPPR